MSKKGGKNKTPPFKITAKIENDAAVVQEMHIKKKILEQKYLTVNAKTNKARIKKC